MSDLRPPARYRARLRLRWPVRPPTPAAPWRPSTSGRKVA